MMMNTTPNADTKVTLLYEKKTCGRCGGSGHYSYNQMHGTVCYGCAGRKTTLTKAGANASKAVQEFIAANFSVKVTDLKAGDVVKYDGRVRTLTTVEIDAEPMASSTTIVDGERITTHFRYVHVTFNKPVPSAFGPVSGAGLCEGQMIQKPVLGADWDRVVEFAKTIKKGVTIQTVAK
jgi:hypothetical protein